MTVSIRKFRTFAQHYCKLIVCLWFTDTAARRTSVHKPRWRDGMPLLLLNGHQRRWRDQSSWNRGNISEMYRRRSRLVVEVSLVDLYKYAWREWRDTPYSPTSKAKCFKFWIWPSWQSPCSWTCMYTVRVKTPLRFLNIFSETVGNFQYKFYTPITRF